MYAESSFSNAGLKHTGVLSKIGSWHSCACSRAIGIESQQAFQLSQVLNGFLGASKRWNHNTVKGTANFLSASSFTVHFSWTLEACGVNMCCVKQL
jgi:hypothetical protein